MAFHTLSRVSVIWNTITFSIRLTSLKVRCHPGLLSGLGASTGFFATQLETSSNSVAGYASPTTHVQVYVILSFSWIYFCYCKKVLYSFWEGGRYLEWSLQSTRWRTNSNLTDKCDIHIPSVTDTDCLLQNQNVWDRHIKSLTNTNCLCLPHTICVCYRHSETVKTYQ